MFSGLQIVTCASVVILFASCTFTVAGAVAPSLDAVADAEHDSQLLLHDGQPNYSATATQSNGIQTVISASSKCVEKKPFLRDKLATENTKLDNPVVPISPEETTRKLPFIEYLFNRPDNTGEVRLNSYYVKAYHEKEDTVRNTKYINTDILNYSNHKENNEIKITFKDAAINTTYINKHNPSKHIKHTKRETNNMTGNLIFYKIYNSKYKTSEQHREHVNASTENNGHENAISDLEKPDAKLSNVSSGQTRAPRQVPAMSRPAISNRNIRAREEGDVIIGAMFPLHYPPAMSNTYIRQCGQIWETYGVQRVEAFLMMVDSINRNPSILPHIKLGWDIRDSCWYSPIALENSIDFIKDAIASQANINADPPPPFAAATSSNSNSKLSTASSETVSTSSTRGHDSTAGCRGNRNLKPIIGLVGPGSSESTIQVQNLLQIFNIPQIGYSATSYDLSNKNHYRYFLRVVPPDFYQAQALVDILLKCNWTYISTIHTDGNYGLKGITEFTDLAKSNGICIAVSDGVASTALDDEFDNILAKLLSDQNASVVVCFCDGMTVRNLFLAIRRRKMERRLLIIGSDGWGNRADVVSGMELEAAGAISVMFHSPPLKDFRPHYEKLKPFKNPKNPWFHEFWEEKFKCSLDKTTMKSYQKLCSGNESLAGSDEDSKLGFVVNAVTAMAVALENMHQDLCPGSSGLCRAMEPINGSIYLRYLQNVSFQSYSGEEVHFDQAGDPSAKYNILNYQPKLSANGSITYDYVTIGTWVSGFLKLDVHDIYWPQGPARSPKGVSGIIRSVCAEPCNWDQAKVTVNSVSSCCWVCTPCPENATVDNNTQCKECKLGAWPNLNKTDCEEIPIEFIYWTDTQAIASITLGSLGICSTLWVFGIFIRHHNTPVVKASTRELSYIILVGICLAFGSNFILVSKPATEVCYLTRILPGLSFSLMYGALVTRTNRIARILEGSKRIMTKKPKFMSATTQIVIAFIIIGVESAFITAMLLYQPAASRLDYSVPKKVRLVCDTSTLGIVVPLGFDLVLIILCTIYAVKTRNLPENFNEAKFIGFTMYATCVIWLGFFPIYFAGENKEITFSISISLSAAVALVLLFIPKVYVIVWVPEKNTRGAFTTSKDVRCHIGVVAVSSGDSSDVKEGGTFDTLLKLDKTPARHWRHKSVGGKRLRFLMQRAAHSEDDTPYINHGIISNHSNARNTTFLERRTNCNYRADSPANVALNCPEQEKLLPEDTSSLTNAQMIRQNLAREFPLHKPQARPGSPAEKEKYRIKNADRVIAWGSQLEMKTLHVPVRFRKLQEIRKSLSSTCVSICPNTVSVQCQTTDDLTGGFLPPLRRRHVVTSKNKLERSKATDDVMDPPSCFVNLQNQSHKRHFTSSEVQDTISLIPQRDCCSRGSWSEISETDTPATYQFCDHENTLSVTDNTAEESWPLHACLENHVQHHNGDHNVLESHYQEHCQDNIDYLCNNSMCTPSHHVTSDHPHAFESSAMLDCNSVNVTKECDDYVNPLYNTLNEAFNRHASVNVFTCEVSPSDLSISGTSPHCEVPSRSTNHQDSCYSTTVSIASSSSFTLPPFHSSTDSDASQQTFNDSLNSLELQETSQGAPDIVCSFHDERELTDIQKHGLSQLQGTKIVDSTCIAPLAPSVASEVVDDDILEFQKYLQGHGVTLQLSTVKSSDL